MKKSHWKTIHMPLSTVEKINIFLEKSIKLEQRTDTIITGVITEKIFLTICSFLNSSYA